jgi:hypothetical protein
MIPKLRFEINTRSFQVTVMNPELEAVGKLGLRG